MHTVPFALYNAFSDISFGGSPAAIVSNANGIDVETRRRLAREVGAPATSFTEVANAETIQAQFFSTVTELPMCGHGTVCLMTRMMDLGILDWQDKDKIEVKLQLPATTASVEIIRRDDSRALVMLDIIPPDFRQDSFELEELSRLLGLRDDDYESGLPMETACGDFTHLIVPTRNLATMRRIKPDFEGIVRFCNAHSIQTIVAFSREVEIDGNTLHVRDFCPAVGVAESAAAGTTNAALSSYLIRHQLVQPDNNGEIVLLAEQGIEIDRPSSIRSVATMKGDNIARLQVGGVATCIMDGQLHLPKSV